MGIHLRNPFENDFADHLPQQIESIGSNTVTVQECRNPDRIGPWRIKRAHSEPNNVAFRRKSSCTILHETRPSLKDFLTRVDEDCAHAYKLAASEEKGGLPFDQIGLSQASEFILQDSKLAESEILNEQREQRTNPISAWLLLPVFVCIGILLGASAIVVCLLTQGGIRDIVLSEQSSPTNEVLSVILALAIFSMSTLSMIAVVSVYVVVRNLRLTRCWVVAVITGGFLSGAIFTMLMLAAMLPVLRRQ